MEEAEKVKIGEAQTSLVMGPATMKRELWDEITVVQLGSRLEPEGETNSPGTLGMSNKGMFEGEMPYSGLMQCGPGRLALWDDSGSQGGSELGARELPLDKEKGFAASGAQLWHIGGNYIPMGRKTLSEKYGNFVQFTVIFLWDRLLPGVSGRGYATQGTVIEAICQPVYLSCSMSI